MSPKKSAHAGARRDTAPLFADGELEKRGVERMNSADSPHAQRIVRGASEQTPWVAGVRAGIDEAGLGPLLGPLAIGYSAFRVPRDVDDLWRVLHTVCTSDVDDDRERLVVADSKLVFTRDSRSERRLERTALVFLALHGAEKRCPLTALEMMERLGSDLRAAEQATAGGAERITIEKPLESRTDGTAVESWRPHFEHALPLHSDRDELHVTFVKLCDAMQRAEIELTRAGVRLVSAPELNASFASTCNKSVTHWRATQSLLSLLWRAHADEGLDLAVDRHGGRMYYAPLLAETFAQCTIHIVSESPPRSEYIVIEHVARANGSGTSSDSIASASDRALRRMRIVFAERAESTSFAVALASCLAKYAREKSMNAFNAYFAALQPGLKPTAGYVTDGRRWLEDAAPAIERSGLRRSDLVRER